MSNKKIREDLAQYIHEEYRKMQLANPSTDQGSPSLVVWGNLNSDLKNSNRGQADHIFVKLRETGYWLRKSRHKNPTVNSLIPEEIKHLAKLEHGQWNAERLLAGWR